MIRKLLAATVLAALSLPAFAQDAEEESSPFSFSVGAVSDYAFRGVSQTNEGPAWQASAEYAHDSGFYAGIWASRVDFVDGDNANIESDWYIGFSTPINDLLTFDASVLRYVYIDQSAYNYNELLLSLGVGEHISFLLGYSNDVFASDETGIYYGVSGSYPLPWAELTLTGSVGHYDLDDVFDDSYQDFSLGVSKEFGPMAVGLSWVHATENLFGQNDGSRYVLSAIWSF
jgi:uncharacterized protein (TIGR02001 family)